MYKFTAILFVVAVATFSSPVEGANSTLLQAKGPEDECKVGEIVSIGNTCCSKGACCVNTGIGSGTDALQLVCSTTSVPIASDSICSGGSCSASGGVCSQLFPIPILAVVGQVITPITRCCGGSKGSKDCNGYQCGKSREDNPITRGGTFYKCCNKNTCSSS